MKGDNKVSLDLTTALYSSLVPIYTELRQYVAMCVSCRVVAPDFEMARLTLYRYTKRRHFNTAIRRLQLWLLTQTIYVSNGNQMSFNLPDIRVADAAKGHHIFCKCVCTYAVLNE